MVFYHVFFSSFFFFFLEENKMSLVIDDVVASYLPVFLSDLLDLARPFQQLEYLR